MKNKLPTPERPIIEEITKNTKELLFDFFVWFQGNGEKYVGISIEKMINIYLAETIV